MSKFLVDCFNCDGTGHVVDPIDPWERDHSDKCVPCDGSGKVAMHCDDCLVRLATSQVGVIFRCDECQAAAEISPAA